jgi:hypothetical protein
VISRCSLPKCRCNLRQKRGAGRCFFLIAEAMLISALEFVGVSWTSFVSPYLPTKKMFALKIAIWSCIERLFLKLCQHL